MFAHPFSPERIHAQRREIIFLKFCFWISLFSFSFSLHFNILGGNRKYRLITKKIQCQTLFSPPAGTLPTGQTITETRFITFRFLDCPNKFYIRHITRLDAHQNCLVFYGCPRKHLYILSETLATFKSNPYLYTSRLSLKKTGNQ